MSGTTWTYTITDTESGTVTFTTGPATNGIYQVTGASGTFEGEAVTGLSDFNTPDQELSLTDPSFFDGVDIAGVSFALANGIGVNFFTDDNGHFIYDDSVNNTDVTSPTITTTACYVRGTLIATPGGERPVELLAAGDMVLTAGCTKRPIKWVGRRSYGGPFLAASPNVQPVRVRAGALGGGLPWRDLLVSPEHALVLDGMLVPARCLLNGETICQERGLDRVDYFHLELDSHDVILAEGAPAESFLDDNSRGMFHNAAEYAARFGAAPSRPATYCLPRLDGGPALEALRRRLAPRTQLPNGRLEGRVDGADAERITGWARDEDAPGRRVHLRLRDNGAILGEVVADAFRADLAAAGIGDGRHAFSFVVYGGLSPALAHSITVERVEDGAALPGGPLLRPAQTLPELRAIAAPQGEVALRGMLDICTRERLAGWALQPGSADPVALQVLDNGVPLGRVLANVMRPDLLRAGVAERAHGFDLILPGGLSPLVRHVIEVRRESDGALLPGTPAVVEAAAAFDDALERAVAAAVAALPPGEAQARALGFLRGQAELLQQGRADEDAGKTMREANRQHHRRWGVDAAQSGRRALVIDATLPEPGQSGGANAVLSHAAALQRLGYAVGLVAAGEMAAESAALAQAGITVYGLPFYASVEEVLRRQAGCFDVVYLHRAEMAAQYGRLVRQYAPGARLLYNVADLHHLRVARQAAVQREPSLLVEARQLRAMELAAAAAADAVLTHSPAEAAVLSRALPQAAVHCVPWSVAPQPRRPDFGARSGVAFIGHYSHAPNVDAASWLAGSVMPLVWQHVPGLECVLAGQAMPAALRRLARPGITVLGSVAELRSVYDRVRLTVAPLRFGAGVKSKVLESFAAALPCVMTPVAAEGIALSPAMQPLVAATAEALAAEIVRLHGDEAANRRVAAAGLRMIRARHSEAEVDAALRAAIAGVAERRVA